MCKRHIFINLEYEEYSTKEKPVLSFLTIHSSKLKLWYFVGENINGPSIGSNEN